MKKGTPTHTKDINGQTICLGDLVWYDFPDSSPSEKFTVVFEDDAFRKSYKGWDKTLQKPLLETGEQAKYMRLKIIKSS